MLQSFGDFGPDSGFCTMCGGRYLRPVGKLVEIARFLDLEEAVCARSFLLSEGVYSFLMNEHSLAAQPQLRFALGGYSLYASSEDAAGAWTTLSAIRRAPGEPETEGPLRRRNWLSLPFALLSEVPFVLRYRTAGGLILQSVLVLFLIAAYFFLACLDRILAVAAR